MATSIPQSPFSRRPAWSVAVIGLPLAILIGGCLGSPRVTSDSINRPAPTAVAGFPASWQPAKPLRKWKSIVLHHTATEAGSVKSIHAAHRKRITNGKPWLGIGYHFVIGNGKGMADGAVEATFRWRDQLHGAHAGKQAQHQHGIGIALLGHFDKQPPSPAQLASLRRLVFHLKTAHAIPTTGLIGHGEIKKTACPGKLFPLATLKKEFAGKMPTR